MNKIKDKINENRRIQKLVIVDTDIILHSLENKIDLVEEIRSIIEYPIQLCVLRSTIYELEKIARIGSWRTSRMARIALKMLVNKNIEIIDDECLGDMPTDEKIVLLAEKLDAIVATDDRELRKKLEKKEIPVIYTREKKKLVLNRNIYW
ncbi:MAG: hypothetical protein DRJ38_00555 [Thermoprotei archaeon]|nr:MAG: hypothetical protein DRJ38_00555 [Thermoprotei archaeon]